MTDRASLGRAESDTGRCGCGGFDNDAERRREGEDSAAAGNGSGLWGILGVADGWAGVPEVTRDNEYPNLRGDAEGDGINGDGAKVFPKRVSFLLFTLCGLSIAAKSGSSESKLKLLSMMSLSRGLGGLRVSSTMTRLGPFSQSSVVDTSLANNASMTSVSSCEGSNSRAEESEALALSISM